MTTIEFAGLKKGDVIRVCKSVSPASGVVVGTQLIFLSTYAGFSWMGMFRPAYESTWNGKPIILAHHQVERA